EQLFEIFLLVGRLERLRQFGVVGVLLCLLVVGLIDVCLTIDLGHHRCLSGVDRLILGGCGAGHRVEIFVGLAVGQHLVELVDRVTNLTCIPRGTGVILEVRRRRFFCPAVCRSGVFLCLHGYAAPPTTRVRVSSHSSRSVTRYSTRFLLGRRYAGPIPSRRQRRRVAADPPITGAASSVFRASTWCIVAGVWFFVSAVGAVVAVLGMAEFS